MVVWFNNFFKIFITNFGNMRYMVAEPMSWAQAVVINSHALMISTAGKLAYDYAEEQHE